MTHFNSNYLLILLCFVCISVVQEEEIKLKPVIAFDCGKFFLARFHSDVIFLKAKRINGTSSIDLSFI